MWKLINIQAQNIISFRDLNYTLNQDVSTLIFGNNLDNDSQSSNGSGKSALLECISIALTGETLRKVKTDEIINDNYDEAVVSVTLFNSIVKQKITINRMLSRKSPQIIQVLLQSGPYDSDVEEIKQASVSDYNKYILETIGLTKDELFNNCVLSKHKYSCFLTASDSVKKEIINRFSNANMVDEAIAALTIDVDQAMNEKINIQLEDSDISGKISAIKEQIDKAIADKENQKTSKEQKKQSLNEDIARYERNIADANKSKRETTEALRDLDDAYNDLLGIEESNQSLEVNNAAIARLYEHYKFPTRQDWIAKSQKYVQSLAEYKKQHGTIQQSLEAVKDKIQQKTLVITEQKKLCTAAKEMSHQNANIINGKIMKIETDLNKLKTAYQKASQSLSEVSRIISEKQAILSGTIVCPACKHEFVLNNNDVDIEQIKTETTKYIAEKDQCQKKLDGIEKERRNLIDNKQELSSQLACVDQDYNKETDTLNKLEREVNRLNTELNEISSKNNNLVRSINETETTIEHLMGDMFDEAFDYIDKKTKEYERQQEDIQLDIKAYESRIEVCKKTLIELDKVSQDSLLIQFEDALKGYEEESKEIKARLAAADEKVTVLLTQGSYFNEFKTHLANSKIEALSNMTNEFLEKIGSDLRIRFNGYTMLKSGKIRDKISITLIRDGIECGSFDKLSEGEKARINLANILAMNRLTNANCETGKGLDLLILDEILEATDETGLSSMFDALNGIGITTLIVSHGNVAENYPYKLVINKQNGVSFLNEKN